jgi:hypothetical protein
MHSAAKRFSTPNCVHKEATLAVALVFLAGQKVDHPWGRPLPKRWHF